MKIGDLLMMVTLFLVSTLGNAEPNVAVTGIPADGDSTITIRKGDRQHGLEPDFEITNGTEEVSGDPVSGMKESYASWKQACADWKKDMREMNGAALISLNCGTPRQERDRSSRVTQVSQGTYKLKVRLRDPQAQH